MTRFTPVLLSLLAERVQQLSSRYASLAKTEFLLSSDDSKELADGYRADADTLANAAEALTDFSKHLPADCQERSETKDTQP